MNEATATLPLEALVAEPDPTPEDAALVNAIVSPPADPRQQKIAELNRQLDALRAEWEIARAERSRLGSRKIPSFAKFNGMPDDSDHNKRIDALIAAQTQIEADSVKESVRVQAEVAALEKGRAADATTASAAYWTGTEKSSVRVVEQTEKVLRTELRRMKAGHIECEAKRQKAAQEVKSTELTLGDFQKMRAREAANPDPLRPGQLRGRDADIKIIRERLDQQKIDLAELDDRALQLQTKTLRVEKKLSDCVLCREMIRLRVLYEQYNALAEKLGPVMRELKEIYTAVDRPQDQQDQLSAVVSFAGRNVFSSIMELPKAFFPPSVPAGEVFADQNNDNYFWR